MDAVIATGVLLAIGYALVPGPVNAETMRRGVRNGFRPALDVQIGALAGDMPWMVLTLTGVTLLLQGRVVSTLLGLFGAGFLMLLARSAFRSAFGRETVGVAVGSGSGWRVGLTLSLANPGALGFWVGAGGGVLASRPDAASGGVWLLILGYTLGALLAGAMLAGLAAMGQRCTRDTVMRWVDGLSGVALAWAGATLLWETIG